MEVKVKNGCFNIKMSVYKGRYGTWALQRDLAVFVPFWKDCKETLYRRQCFPKDELLGCFIVLEKKNMQWLRTSRTYNNQ